MLEKLMFWKKDYSEEVFIDLYEVIYDKNVLCTTMTKNSAEKNALQYLTKRLTEEELDEKIFFEVHWKDEAIVNGFTRTRVGYVIKITPFTKEEIIETTADLNS